METHIISKEKFYRILKTFEKNKDQFPQFFKNPKELSNLTGSWFIGPKFENGELLLKALSTALQSNKDYRELYHPEDPVYITESIKKSVEYEDDIHDFFEELNKFLQSLKVSTPFYSYRSLGHMNWEVSIPAIVGYFAAMLYNQNNVALEASPATTVMERSVAVDLCNMLGYSANILKNNGITAWGHITCDGSIANIETVWVARNLKFYPVALQQVLKTKNELADAKLLKIEINDVSKTFIDLNEWEILNIPGDISLSIPNKILNICSKVSNKTFNNWIKPYLVQELGLLQMYSRFLPNAKPPVVIGPSSAHYSWPKACAITGIGSNAFIHVHLNNYARMNIAHLDNILDDCLRNKVPVLEVVAVMGTTEEGAVDPLVKIVELKKKYAAKGLHFLLHADAAWGGYFASTLHGEKITNKSIEGFVPNLSLSKYTKEQFAAVSETDTITIDPHKAGYVPYPAGALCYRNSALKNLISFIPSYIDHGSDDPSMGLFGIEGSKPGAAAASVFLSHKVMPPNVNGIGKVLGESLFSAKYFYAMLVGFEHDDFICVPIVQPQTGSKSFVKKNILGKTNLEILSNNRAIEWLSENGQDTTIISYFFNFKDKNGNINSSIEKMNELNNKLYEILSIPSGSSIEDVKHNPLFITSSEFDVDKYGNDFINNQLNKANVIFQSKPLSFLISTIMCPWITATEKGNYFGVIMDTITKALETAMQKIDNGE